MWLLFRRADEQQIYCILLSGCSVYPSDWRWSDFSALSSKLRAAAPRRVYCTSSQTHCTSVIVVSATEGRHVRTAGERRVRGRFLWFMDFFFFLSEFGFEDNELTKGCFNSCASLIARPFEVSLQLRLWTRSEIRNELLSSPRSAPPPPFFRPKGGIWFVRNVHKPFPTVSEDRARCRFSKERERERRKRGTRGWGGF